MRKIWCSIGDDYDKMAFDCDTPCKYNGELFLLSDAKNKTEDKKDFYIYLYKSWVPACLTDRPIAENFQVTFQFPQTESGVPNNYDINVVLKALEETLDSEEFKGKVRKVLANDRISIVARTNVYYGY